MGTGERLDLVPPLFAKRSLVRCWWCGRKGTLTDLSMGNRCVLEDDCWAAREEMLAQAAAVATTTS